jgi:hypothetical protein
MQDNIWVQVFWLACVATAIVASVMANLSRWPNWSRRARYAGRVAVGSLMILGGALVNAANLVSGGSYAGFADQAHFGWVTAAWHAVVAPNQYLFIGLLVAFEAIVGVLILSGGRRTQVGLVAAIGFHTALWLFGWVVTIYVLIMLPVLVMLFRAERHAASISAVAVAPATAPDMEVARSSAE